MLDRDSHHLFYINFYSKQDTQVAQTQLKQLEKINPILGSLLLKHFRDERNKRGALKSLRAAGLSEREAQICNMILQGHTAKSIGNELTLSESTVITYKKRAYEKLQIKRKSELIKFV